MWTCTVKNNLSVEASASDPHLFCAAPDPAQAVEAMRIFKFMSRAQLHEVLEIIPSF